MDFTGNLDSAATKPTSSSIAICVTPQPELVRFLGCRGGCTTIQSPRRRARAASAAQSGRAPGRLEVDGQLILGRCLHRKVGRFLALEDAIDVAGGATVLVYFVRSVGDKATIGHEKADGVDGGQAVPSRRRGEQTPEEARPAGLP